MAIIRECAGETTPRSLRSGDGGADGLAATLAACQTRLEMRSSARIVVFTGDLAYSVRRGILGIDMSIPGLCWLFVVHAPPKTLTLLLRNQRRNLVRNGWRWIPYQAGDILRRVFSRSARVESSMPGSDFSLAALESRPNVQVSRA